MAYRSATNLRLLEGLQVSIALLDGSRIDDCNLVSSGCNRLDNLWVFVNGEDTFVARSDVVDIWQEHANHPSAA